MDGALEMIHDVHVEATFPVDTKLVCKRRPKSAAVPVEK